MEEEVKRSLDKSPKKMQMEEEDIGPNIFQRESHYIKIDETYQPPNFWEDLGSAFDNQDERYLKDNSIRGVGIMTLDRNTEFMNKVRRDNRNLLEVESQAINYGYFRKNLDMLMMGIEGNIFLLDRENGLFLLSNAGLSLSELSRTLILHKRGHSMPTSVGSSAQPRSSSASNSSKNTWALPTSRDT
jgi:hypothetical protein